MNINDIIDKLSRTNFKTIIIVTGTISLLNGTIVLNTDDIDNKYIIEKEINSKKIVVENTNELATTLLDVIIDPLLTKQNINSNLILTQDEAKTYIITDDRSIENKLDELSFQYNILGLSHDESVDYIKSSILYHSIESENYLFKNESELKKRIELTASLLATVAELETKAYNYSFSVMSPTKAFGRYQINGSTLAEVIMFLTQENKINFNKIDISHLQGKYPYNKIKEQIFDYAKKSFEETGKKWTWKLKQSRLDDLLVFNKRFIYSIKNYLDMYPSDSSIQRYANKVLKTNNKYSTTKIYDYTIKVLESYKNPINQGFFSCKIFELKMKQLGIEFMKNSSNESVYNTVKLLLQKYNADSKVITYNGTKMKKYEKYALKGLDFFKTTNNNTEIELGSI